MSGNAGVEAVYERKRMTAKKERKKVGMDLIDRESNEGRSERVVSYKLERRAERAFAKEKRPPRVLPIIVQRLDDGFGQRSGA
jgi:hypothetical protein